MRNCISGVILYDETIRQKAADGTPLVELISAAGAVPGIKVDAGAKPLALFPGETITEGLDGLRERLKDYYGLGARFAKWRAVIAISDGLPTCRGGSAERRCACPLCGALPGGRHRADRRAGGADGRRSGHPFDRPLRGGDPTSCWRRCSTRSMRLASRWKAWCSSRTWSSTARTPARRRPRKWPRRTLRVLRRTVPRRGARHRLPVRRPVGRGGDGPSVADERRRPAPWKLTFSYGRALQAAAIRPGAASPRTWRPGSAPSRTAPG